MSRATRPGLLFALSLGLFLGAGPAPAQPQQRDLLEEVRARQEVAGQRLENEVREARSAAYRLVKSDPARAADLLKSMLTRLEAEANLAADRRASLKRSLSMDLRYIEDNLRRPDRGPESAALAAEKTLRQAEAERQAHETLRIQRGLQDVGNLRRDGRFEEASRLASDLARRYPGNVATQASRGTTSAAQSVADARRLRDDMASRTLAASRDITRSALPALGDYELPADWAEKTQRRAKRTELTAEERALLKALNTVISAEFKDTPFSGVLDYLQAATKQTILVDRQALAEANVTYDTPVTLTAKAATFRSVLKRVLGDLNLAYVIKEGAIQVTTRERASLMMTTRVYYIGDLAAVVDVRFGPVFNQLQMLQNVAIIMDQVVNSIDPQSWQINGGQGTIAFDPGTMSLIVKQSAEVHSMLGVGLR